MNIVITINLAGTAYQLEKGGYDALRDYLDHAARQLEGNPDRDEILADIEQAIGEKFRALLGAYKNVVSSREADAVIREMGPVQDPSAEAGAAPAGASESAPSGAGPTGPGAAEGAKPPPRRLYKIAEGAMIAGVCNGLSAYLNIDVTIIRLLFAVLTVFTWGAGVLLYLVMLILIPTAQTPEERAAASGGAPSTAEEFIRRAREGYYEGLRTMGDRQAHREWKRRFKREMRGWRRNFRREMMFQSSQWAHHWREHWARNPVVLPGAWFAIPVLTLLIVACTLAGLAAVFSVVVTGAFFGIALPATMPLWVGVVLVLVACHLLLWPLKAMRSSFVWQAGGGPWYPGPVASLWNSFAWVALLMVLVWAANKWLPGAHEFFLQLRPHLRQALDSVRDWWAGR